MGARVSRTIQLSGQRFGSVTVVSLAEPGGSRKHAKWTCRCDCGREFVTVSHVIRSGKIKTCGCRDRLKRFWPRVNRDCASGCWEWTGPRSPCGYGRLHWGGRVRLATHVALDLVGRGAPPRGKVVRHTCDNPSCVNPDHLIVGTQAENARDMAERGRSTKGRQFNAKLSEAQAREIYALRGVARGRSVAQRYGVAPSTVRNIWTRLTWAWMHSAEQ